MTGVSARFPSRLYLIDVSGWVIGIVKPGFLWMQNGWQSFSYWEYYMSCCRLRNVEPRTKGKEKIQTFHFFPLVQRLCVLTQQFLTVSNNPTSFFIKCHIQKTRRELSMQKHAEELFALQAVFAARKMWTYIS